MAETIAPARDRPLVLGGVSLGGMLAYETLIPEGGHLINVTHAGKVNAFLRQTAGNRL